MITRFVEVKHDGLEGRFMVAQWEDHEMHCEYPENRAHTFLGACGWGSPPSNRRYMLVIEINGGAEGGIFLLGGDPEYDLQKRGLPNLVPKCLWIVFLTWLYENIRAAEFSDLPVLAVPELLEL